MWASFVPVSSPTSASYCCSRTTTSLKTYPIAPAGVSSLSLRQRQPIISCSIPPRDVVIDFGKFKGSKMGTLPSSYLRWLIREVSETRYDVWAKYAEEVLHDPHYRDRLEWESIEKLAIKADMRKGGHPTENASVKNQMEALGWDLSNRRAWDKVNFSLLGTSLGGRIPRKETKSEANPKPKSTSTFTSTRKTTNKTNVPSPTKLAANAESKSLSLREELQRRRMLRRERTQSKSSSFSSNMDSSGSGITQFPGRDSLLKRAKDRGENR